MKTYQIKYQKVGVKLPNNTKSTDDYRLVDITEIIKTNDLKMEIEKLKTEALKFKSNIFPNLKGEFILKDVSIL
jgi:hypothetical protein